MTKFKLLLQICQIIWFLQLTSGTEESSNSAVWPDLSCHEGYLKIGRSEDENGEEILRLNRRHCDNDIQNQWMGDESPDCLQRCLLEYLEILVYRKFEFNSEDTIAQTLNRYLFTYTPETGKQVAKQILESDCQLLLTALANAESKPTCEDQDEFIRCIEESMKCK